MQEKGINLVNLLIIFTRKGIKGRERGEGCRPGAGDRGGGGIVIDGGLSSRGGRHGGALQQEIHHPLLQQIRRARADAL
jgi:hypothetical protein